MENKFVRVSFNVEMAKKIQNKEIEGKIVTPENKEVRIICWDRKDSERPIVGLIYDYKLNKELVELFSDGNTNDYKFENDLLLEIPEHMTFKDGDIVTTDYGVFIFKGVKEAKNSCPDFEYYVYATNDYLSYFNSSCCGLDIINKIHLSSKEDKEYIIEALKRSNNSTAKEYLRRFFGIDIPKDSNSSQIGKNYEFKPFDKVLVRYSTTDTWKCDMFSDVDYTEPPFIYRTFSSCYQYCIPYNEQTAHLIGTSDDWVEDKNK